ncbi:MAG: oligosaccharide flippase family protein [Candidatus Aureabacteria bacterium]|nr:oligosaccharide flippase family protein [Candidatus Auribacterota bacterium]
MKRVLSNTLALFSSKAAMLLASLALAAILARRLGPDRYGDFRTAFSLCALLGVLIELGMDKIAIRECSIHNLRARAWVGTALSLKLLFSVLGMLLALGAVFFFGYQRRLAPLIFIGIGVYAASALANSLVVVFRSHEVMGREALIKTSKSLLLLGLVFLGARSALGTAFFYLLSALFQVVFSWFLVRRLFFPPAFLLERDLARRLAGGGLLLALAVFFNSFQEIIRVIVYWKQGAAAAGCYSAGASFFQALEGLVPLSLAGALFPLVCRLRRAGSGSVAGIYRRCGNYLFIIALPFAVVSLVLAPRLCVFFFGSAFAASASTARVLGVVALLMVQNYLFFDLMVATGKERLFAAVMAVGALINAALALFFVSLFGLAGAAAGAGIAQLVLCLVFFRILRRDLAAASPLRLLRPLPGAAALAASLWGLEALGLPLPLILLPGLLLYAGGLVILRALGREDWALLKEIFPGGRRG